MLDGAGVPQPLATDVARLAERAMAADARARVADDRAKAEDALALVGTSNLHATHLRLASGYRRGAAVHRRTAAWCRVLIERESLERQGTRPSEDDLIVMAAFLVTRSPSVALTLQTSGGRLVARCSTDAVARSAQDIEFVVGEGVLSDAAGSVACVVVGGEEIAERWPMYGPRVVELGVDSVAAVSLVSEHGRGALALFNPSLEEADGEALDWLAGSAMEVLCGRLSTRAQVELPLALTAELHQAVGVVAGQLGCDVSTATALLRARAYADGVETDIIARKVLAGSLRISL
jgi:hypothetical protein